jgi:hypothetical protein
LMHAFLSLSSLFLALGLMKFNTNLSQVKVFARFCLSKQTLISRAISLSIASIEAR